MYGLCDMHVWLITFNMNDLFNMLGLITKRDISILEGQMDCLET